MKKITVLAVASLTLTLSSCKKAYTCVCTTTDSNGSLVSTRDISKTSEKTAQAICGNSSQVYTETFNAGSGTSTSSYNSLTSCDLK